MKIIDVTRPLVKGMLVYPGDSIPSFVQADHGRYLISDIHLSSHTGTHIDAPAHYLKSGDTIDTIPLRHIIGRCRVIDLSGTGSSSITEDDLEGKLQGVKRILLKTWFSPRGTFCEDYPSLTHDAACCITKSGIECIGIDSPSIESYNCDGSVHRRLLGSGCIIIELLDLSDVTGGDYEMVALPLRLAGLDGSPARVILIKQEGM
ncbi:MAG: cyclase family protein [Methanoregulaceae archaeon]|nr:MAG: cyclase family protein [Methanoregulaceae archaeon]